jgi:membrane-bound ClpP family serine protease
MNTDLVQAVGDGMPFVVGDALWALLLLAIAAILLLLEFLIASYGLLAIAAFACAVTGIVLGFGSAPAVGWTLLALTPVLAVAIVGWGLRRLMRSELVPKAEIREDAGYRHASESLGIAIGSRGTLVSDAMPTGRARFPGGDLDVLVEGPAAGHGAVVIVRRIEGPTIIVTTEAPASP